MKSLISGLCLTILVVGNVTANETKPITVDVLAKSTTSWDGSVLPNYPKGKPEVTILKIDIAPGVQLPLHEHPVINAGYLVSGELTVVTQDDEILELKAGDTLVEVINKWHYGINKGDVPAEIVVFYAGIEGEPLTIKHK
ncbi:Cupin 2 conserved barrel domain protein [Moritella viscosa]|uniref:cupin domain-containing protein n=1 Tax=Moritella viscosa TaxID=80854 RepID=UPI00090F69AC|nr:cupin domain-containing protein [Moritella viscosa]SGZ05418.1 Cupin 2 conserved barrel domain protein [Moritella viscosa]